MQKEKSVIITETMREKKICNIVIVKVKGIKHIDSLLSLVRIVRSIYKYILYFFCKTNA